MAPALRGYVSTAQTPISSCEKTHDVQLAHSHLRSPDPSSTQELSFVQKFLKLFRRLTKSREIRGALS